MNIYEQIVDAVDALPIHQATELSTHEVEAIQGWTEAVAEQIDDASEENFVVYQSQLDQVNDMIQTLQDDPTKAREILNQAVSMMFVSDDSGEPCCEDCTEEPGALAGGPDCEYFESSWFFGLSTCFTKIGCIRKHTNCEGGAVTVGRCIKSVAGPEAAPDPCMCFPTRIDMLLVLLVLAIAAVILGGPAIAGLGIREVLRQLTLRAPAIAL